MSERAKTYSFRPPLSLGVEMERVAEENGVSVNAWMIAEIGRAVEAARFRKMWRERRERGDMISDHQAKELLRGLSGDAEPVPGDENRAG